VGGEAGDTQTFDNFAAALSSRNFLDIKNLSFEAGWAKQHASPTDVRDEYSWVLGIAWEVELFPGYVLRPMSEFASVTGQAGLNLDTSYFTVGSELEVAKLWTFALNATWRDVREYDIGNYHIDLTTGASVAYQIGNLFKDRFAWMDGLSFATGYRFDRRFGVERHSVGFQLRYEREL
jgi:hypothetical protein